MDNQINDQENIEAFQSEATAHKLPVGWVILFIGLFAFAVYYFIAYMPNVSGWTQSQAYEESLGE